MSDDWISFLKEFPGAAHAFVQLLGDVGNLGSAALQVGIAKLEAKRGAIEASDEAGRRIAKAEASLKIGELEEAEKTLRHRAELARASKEARTQVNREAIAQIAFQKLREDPPHNPARQAPSSDWLNYFSDHAERATSEDLREHWAYILEREIRKSGSISIQSLHISSLLDKPLAEKIKRIARFVVLQRAIPEIGELEMGDGFQDLLDLANVGIVNLSKTGISLPSDRDRAYFYDGGHRYLKIKYKEDTMEQFKQRWPDGRLRINLSVNHLTTAGREIISIVGYEKDPRLLEKMILEMEKHMLHGEITSEKPAIFDQEQS